MKFLEILVSFLTQQGMSFFDSNAQSMTRQITNNARKFSILLALTVIFIALFCIGFSMTFSSLVASLQNSTDGATTEWFKTGIIAGSILCVLAVGGLIYSLGEKRWMKALAADEEQPEEKQNERSPIEGAVAVLILEAVNEMRARRAAKKSEASEAPSANAL